MNMVLPVAAGKTVAVPKQIRPDYPHELCLTEMRSQGGVMREKRSFTRKLVSAN